jgi:UDP-glucose 4-epimerase
MIIPHRTSQPFFSIDVISFNHRDGTCVRDYLHIMDLASGHVLALEALTSESQIFDPDSSAFFKAYNLGKGKVVSVLQIVEAMRRATGFDYKYEVIGRRLGLSNLDPPTIS